MGDVMKKLLVLALTFSFVSSLNGAAAGVDAPDGVLATGRVDDDYGPYEGDMLKFGDDLNMIFYEGNLPEDITPEKFNFILKSLAEKHPESLPDEFGTVLIAAASRGDNDEDESCDEESGLCHRETSDREPAEAYVTEENIALLKKIGTSVNVSREGGWTALHVAACGSEGSGTEVVVKRLIDAGANVNASLTPSSSRSEERRVGKE